MNKIAIWSTLARSLVAAGPKIRALGGTARSAAKTLGTKATSIIPKSIAGKATAGSVLGAAGGAGSYNPQNDTGDFSTSRFGAMAKGALGGAAVGASAGVISKGIGRFAKGTRSVKPLSNPGIPSNAGINAATGSMGSIASEWIDETFEKLAEDLIPGTPKWIKSKGKKRKLEKKAFIGGEDHAGKTQGTEKTDPYQTTKSLGKALLGGHVAGITTDISAAGLAAVGGFKGLKHAIGTRGLKEGLKAVARSGGVRKDFGTILKSQRYILPVTGSVSAAYLAKSYKKDKDHITKNGPEFSQQEHKTASIENDPYRTTKTVAGVELANHGLNILTDIAAAGLAAAGGFKGLKAVMKPRFLRKKLTLGQGLAKAFTSPEFKKDMRTMMKSQKYIIPVGAGISAAYLAKAYHDDLQHKTASDESPREQYVDIFGKSILKDNRPDHKYDAKELAMGIKVEHEHTKKVLPYAQATFIATKIAKDHLDEFPDYYTRLAKLEEQAKKAKASK